MTYADIMLTLIAVLLLLIWMRNSTVSRVVSFKVRYWLRKLRGKRL